MKGRITFGGWKVVVAMQTSSKVVVFVQCTANPMFIGSVQFYNISAPAGCPAYTRAISMGQVWL